MHHIDEKFKDAKPTATVEKIQGILAELGIETSELWSDSGIENCYSLSVSGKGGIPSANGKGVTKEFAQASAYGEFIERLQGGLFFYKYQSLHRNKAMDLHTYAPDGKYMTVEELIENGGWMDYTVEAYKYPGLTRKTIAEQCKMYACSDDGKVLTLPFYSLFEKKYVYLPIAFIDQVHATNGCCAGNTREEAWVHAFSEIMERHATLEILTKGKAAPRIPEETLEAFPTVSRILKKIRSRKEYQVDIFDFSPANGFPVISTRIISKKDHTYKVNVAADPVFEIAVQRTLTEFFQGVNIENIGSRHSGKVLKSAAETRTTQNVLNQLETGNGFFAADYFSEELTCTKTPTDFVDNSQKSNRELLEYCLSIYKQMGKPVYVRNFSFLGFPSYRFVVPGLSESFGVKMAAPVQEYAVADQVCGTFRNTPAATDADLNWMLMYSKMIQGTFSRYQNFGRISGLPTDYSVSLLLSCVTRAYAAYRLNKSDEVVRYLTEYIKSRSKEDEAAQYFSCITCYLELKQAGIDEEKIRLIIEKFFHKEQFEALYECLDAGETPFEPYLIRCDFENCDSCRYRENCCYHEVGEIIARVGKVYRSFTDGQAEKEFEI